MELRSQSQLSKYFVAQPWSWGGLCLKSYCPLGLQRGVVPVFMFIGGVLNKIQLYFVVISQDQQFPRNEVRD